MNRSAPAKFDWPGWRADVVERLDRRSVGAGSAYAAAITAVTFVGPWPKSVAFALHGLLFDFSTLMVTLGVLAVALVAVAVFLLNP